MGCNSNLIALIKIKSKSFIAAGSTITEDVKEGSFVIARTKQITKLDYAKKYKFKKQLQKQAHHFGKPLMMCLFYFL